jgi:hypothetical protein
MKTNFILRVAGIFMALLLTTGIAFSGNDYAGRGRNHLANGTCVSRISGLSQDQKDRITALETQHQTTMNELREQRRSTTDVSQKDQVRKQMDSQIDSHRNAVRAILNPDQQKQFDQLPRNGGNQGYGRGQGNQAGGSGNCTGRGNGRRGR